MKKSLAKKFAQCEHMILLLGIVKKCLSLSMTIVNLSKFLDEIFAVDPVSGKFPKVIFSTFLSKDGNPQG